MVDPESPLYPPIVDGTDLQITKDPKEESYQEMGAVLSEDKTYRYYIWREWDPTKPALPWILCNPSYADGNGDDRTMKKVYGYSKQEGYGSCFVANLFAYQTKQESELEDVEDPVGPFNDLFLNHISEHSDRVAAAWGNIGMRGGRPAEVVNMMDVDFLALRTVGDNNPGHPGRTSYDLELTPWNPSV